MNRSLAIIVACASALVMAGLVVALIAVRQPESAFPSGTPEAAVADYLRLLQNGDLDGAFALTSMQIGSRALDSQTFHNQNSRWSEAPHRVTLVSSKTNGNQATVAVDVATFEPDVLGGSDRTSRQTFALARRDDGWRITTPTSLY
jgi:hypothetical protein